MLNKYINLQFLAHLNNYDLVNKFNYKNFFIIPKFTKLSLRLFLKGALSVDFHTLYLKSYLLLFLFCFNILNTKLKFKKLRRRKLKSYKIKLLLSYFFLKKKIYATIFSFVFLFKKFIRPFYFSTHPNTFSLSSGKCFFSFVKIITFIPSLMLLDHKEHRYFPFFKKSKVFLTFTLKFLNTGAGYNFFFKSKQLSKNFLKNFLLFWCLI